MHTESRTIGLVLAYSALAWLIAGVLVTNFGPHVSTSEGMIIPESLMFIMLALRLYLLTAKRPGSHGSAIKCEPCVWDAIRGVCLLAGKA